MTKSGWKRARLGDESIALTASGGTPDRSNPENFGGGIPWVKSGELDDNLILTTAETLTRSGLAGSSAKVFPPGTLLLAMYGATAGKTGILGIEASTNQAVCSIFPQKGSFDSQFLQFQLIYLRPTLLSARSGGAQPNISQRVISTVEVALPPIREQQAIAKALLTVQKAKAVRQRELILERERKAALMKHLFTFGTLGANRHTKDSKYGKVPCDWKVLPLDECAFMQTGVAKGRKLLNSETVSVPYLRVANVQDGYLNLSEVKSITIRKSELSRFQLQQGDVLLTEGGDFDKLGRGFIWNGKVTPCVHQNHIFAVRPRADFLTPEFFAFQVQSPYGKSYFLSVAHRTTNLASINKTKLGRFPTLIAPLAEQASVVRFLKACDAKIAALEREIKLSEELLRATLEEFMSDRLAVIQRTEDGKPL